jgi:hypothetical protein
MVRAWHGRGMANVNQTRPHCVNQTGNTHSETLAARHGRETAWARHAMCESALTHFSPARKYSWYSFLLEAESTPGSQYGRKDFVNGKFQ